MLSTKIHSYICKLKEKTEGQKSKHLICYLNTTRQFAILENKVVSARYMLISGNCSFSLAVHYKIPIKILSVSEKSDHSADCSRNLNLVTATPK